ncbi:hypothetical protein KFE25_003457 [Diacronema lutheri]|uniref:GST N-terminal domain-containing protein n=2 Tax=Diacronema lutheri TaxID=2081491 RepID=A0A8J6C9B3_DIALT|nr:hypothetical protein KFE25_003457 [Diacronema lutheri]
MSRTRVCAALLLLLAAAPPASARLAGVPRLLARARGLVRLDIAPHSSRDVQSALAAAREHTFAELSSQCAVVPMPPLPLPPAAAPPPPPPAAAALPLPPPLAAAPPSPPSPPAAPPIVVAVAPSPPSAAAPAATPAAAPARAPPAAPTEPARPPPPPSPPPFAAGPTADALRERFRAKPAPPPPPPAIEAVLSWAQLEALAPPGGMRRSSGRGAIVEPLAARSRTHRAFRLRALSAARALGLRRPAEPPSTKAGLVLWRDTNGWCPYCERVWIALEAMGVEYAERTVNLQQKDSRFLSLARHYSPTGRSSVPVLTTPDGEHVLWESADILAFLSGRTEADAEGDTAGASAASFDATGAVTQVAKSGRRNVVPALRISADAPRDAWPLTPASSAQLALVARVMAAVSNATAAVTPPAFGPAAGRAPQLSSADMLARFNAAAAALDALDAELGRTPGPFFGGQLVSAADCSIAPFLERYSRNGAIANGDIPQLADLAARARGRAWPHIARWYGAMDGWAPYASRIEGDAYSYAKLAGTFARFGLRLRAGAPARDGAEGAGGERGGGRARRALRAAHTAARTLFGRARAAAADASRAARRLPPPPPPPPPLTADALAALERRAADADATALSKLPSVERARELLAVGSGGAAGEPTPLSARLQIGGSLAGGAAGDASAVATGAARGEALANLAVNRRAVLADALAGCGLAATGDERVADEADAYLRLVGTALAARAPRAAADMCDGAASALARTLGRAALDAEVRARLAKIGEFVARRLCVPRDMGQPAAEQLRAALLLSAHALRG